MKKLLVILVSTFALFSCEKQGELTKSQSIVISNQSVLKYSGQFTSAPNESVSGQAKIYLDHRSIN